MNSRHSQDVLWHLPEALNPDELTLLRTAVAERRGRELNWRALHLDGSPAELCRECDLKGGDRLYIAGGDGSVHCAVETLLEHRAGKDLPEIAILPRGTGNDFARTLEVPLDDWPAAVEVAVGAHLRCSDLGRCNGQVFVNAVTMGFGAEATRDISVPVKQVVGGAGYAALTAWKAIVAEPFPLKVSGDRVEWEGEALALIVLNGKTIGGGAQLGADAHIDDGLLDMVIVPDVGIGDLRDLVSDWYQRDPKSYELLRYLQSERFTIQSGRELALSIDGEPSSGKELSLQLDPARIHFVAAGKQGGEA